MTNKPIYFVDSIVLGLMVLAEMTSSRYLGNILVLGKFWAFFQLIAVAALVLSFTLNVRSVSAINNAMSMTKSSKDLDTWSGIIPRYQRYAICGLSLIFGQWWLLFCYGCTVGCMSLARQSAAKYLSKVQVDPATKTAAV